MSLMLTFIVPVFIFLGVVGVITLIWRGRLVKDLPPIKFPEYFPYSLTAIILAFNLFAFRTRVGVGYGLFALSVLLSLFLSSKRLRVNRLAQALVLAGSFSGLMLGWHANGFVQGVNLAVVLAVLVSLIFLYAASKIVWEGLAVARIKWRYFVNLIYNVPRLLRSSVTATEEKSETLNIAAIIKTSVVAFIVVAVFVEVLSTADPVFRRLIDEFSHQVIPRAAYSILLAIVFTLLLSVRLSKERRQSAKLSWLSFRDFFVSLLAVDLLFAFFLFVQAKYLFGGNSAQDLVEFGLTYSEYVRKGFAELLVVTVLGGGLAYFTYLKQRVLQKDSQIFKLKMVNAFLLLQLGLVLVSAFKRDLLYVDIYGLTRTRFIGGAFLVWLAVLLGVILGLVLIQKMREKHLFALLGGVTVAVVLFLNLFNLDAYIARAKPPSSRSKDYFYINNLSEDAVDGWIASVPGATKTYNSLYQKPQLSEEERRQLAEVKLSMVALKIKRDALIDKYGDGEGRESKWQAFNLSEYRAYQKILENPDLFNQQLKCVIDETLIYQKHYQIDLYKEESQRLYEFSYPFVGMQIRGKYHPISFAMERRSGLPLKAPTHLPAVKVKPIRPDEVLGLEPPGVVIPAYDPAYDKIPSRAPQSCD